MTVTKTPSALLIQIASVAVIDQAYDWVCQQREHYPAHADIWDLRFHWRTLKIALISELLKGGYCFSPQQCIRLASSRLIHLWGARDALVLKAIAIVIGPRLGISPRYTHVKGHGGLKGALRYSIRHYTTHRFVCRTDVKGYYEHIDPSRLMDQLDSVIVERDVRRLLVQTIRRTVEHNGNYRTISKGIGRESPLSPLYGALYLKPLDDALDQAGIRFVRYG